jgi:hypothetical protein
MSTIARTRSGFRRAGVDGGLHGGDIGTVDEDGNRALDYSGDLEHLLEHVAAWAVERDHHDIRASSIRRSSKSADSGTIATCTMPAALRPSSTIAARARSASITATERERSCIAPLSPDRAREAIERDPPGSNFQETQV